jgi:hypothetical protein
LGVGNRRRDKVNSEGKKGVREVESEGKKTEGAVKQNSGCTYNGPCACYLTTAITCGCEHNGRGAPW